MADVVARWLGERPPGAPGFRRGFRGESLRDETTADTLVPITAVLIA